MRALLRFIGMVVFIVAVVVLAIFAIQNTQAVRASFAGQSFSAGVWWLVLGAAILGFVLAAILVTPGWISAGWRGRTLRRTTAQREQELVALRREHEQTLAEHERLLAEHREVVAERDRLRSGAGMGAVQPTAAAVPVASAEPAPRAGTTTTVYSADQAPATGPGYTTMGGPVAPQPQQPQQPLPQRRQEEWTPNGPAVPTT